MNKMLNDYADALMYLMLRVVQFGLLALGLFVFVGQLIWGMQWMKLQSIFLLVMSWAFLLDMLFGHLTHDLNKILYMDWLYDFFGVDL